MRKLIIIALIVISGFVSVPAVSAQYPEQPGIYRGQKRGWNKPHTIRYQQLYFRTSRGRVYRDIYRCSYNRRGSLVDRQFVRRERVRRYEGMNERQTGLQFNIFLDF